MYLQNTSEKKSASHKKAVRIIAKAHFRERSLPLFRPLGILPLSELHEYCLGKFMYRQHKK